MHNEIYQEYFKKRNQIKTISLDNSINDDICDSFYNFLEESQDMNETEQIDAKIDLEIILELLDTPRKKEFLIMIKEEYTAEEIGSRYGIKPKSVNHFKCMLIKELKEKWGENFG